VDWPVPSSAFAAKTTQKTQHGRERISQLDQRSIETLLDYLQLISKQWDEPFGRLRRFVHT
jgi:hypothetical protein